MLMRVCVFVCLFAVGNLGGVSDAKPCNAMLGKSCPMGTALASGKSCEPGIYILCFYLCIHT